MLTIGHKSFCEKEAANARIQVTEANGNKSFQPIVQRTDPDSTVYDDVEQILLNEGLQLESAKRKLKLVTSSHQSTAFDYETQQPSEENAHLNVEQEPYLSLPPEDVSDYLEQVQNVDEIVFNDDDNNENPKEFCSLETATQSQGGGQDLNHPKYSSTPANKKLKRGKVVHPEEVPERKKRREKMLAANAMREAAEKITEAASMIVKCMKELKPEIKSLDNRNYREIQLSANALKQLVSFSFVLFPKFHTNYKTTACFYFKKLGN